MPPWTIDSPLTAATSSHHSDVTDSYNLHEHDKIQINYMNTTVQPCHCRQHIDSRAATKGINPMAPTWHPNHHSYHLHPRAHAQPCLWWCVSVLLLTETYFCLTVVNWLEKFFVHDTLGIFCVASPVE